MQEPSKPRILYADDHDNHRHLILLGLKRQGYEVLTAGSVGGALHLASRVAFDLFLLDIHFPDGSGIELCQQLRELQVEVAVLFLSASWLNDEEKRELDNCSDGHLCKPASMDELVQAIEAALVRKKGRR